MEGIERRRLTVHSFLGMDLQRTINDIIDYVKQEGVVSDTHVNCNGRRKRMIHSVFDHLQRGYP